MKRLSPRLALTATMLLSTQFAQAQTRLHEHSVAATGKTLAMRVCWTCHVVASDQPFAPMLNQPAPSFADIANRSNTSASALRRFLTKTHWDEATIPMSMPGMMLTDDQVGAVSAYILSLRKRP
jgi:mono/diheme cytochrome c family protein